MLFPEKNMEGVLYEGKFANTFPIGFVVASSDSSSLSHVTLRRCPLRLYDEDSSEVLCDSLILFEKIVVVSQLFNETKNNLKERPLKNKKISQQYVFS